MRRAVLPLLLIFLIFLRCDALGWPGAQALEDLRPIRGAALGHVHVRGLGYGSAASARVSRSLLAHGLNTVQLNPFGYQPAARDRRITFSDPTLTDQDLRAEIRTLHGTGLRVMLAPHLWIGDELTPSVWRSQLRYSDPAEATEWFAAYSQFILHYARIAREENVAIFAVGVELEGLTVHDSLFRELIAAVRRDGYRGALTYECEAWNAPNIRFWDALDFIGLNFYYSFSREVRSSNPQDFARLTEFIGQKLRQHYDLGARLGKPIVLTEFGYPSHPLAISRTSSWPATHAARDDEAQMTGLAALDAAFRKVGHPAGAIVWKYVTALDSYERRTYPTDFTLNHKPAEALLAPLFAGFE
ncbi:MAG: hypothetical protein HS115_13155 [Spirochaetales bacterium]|nr:hypothetical protein [Spirochaetales bacterium]